MAGAATYVVFATPGGALLGVLRSPYHDLGRLAGLRDEWRAAGSKEHGARFVRGALMETW